MNFQQALEFLETLPDMERARHGTGISMSVESMKKLLALLGHPETKAKTVHITGSKGKGSTATFIASILQAQGYRTALFTSPHLHSYRERIAFDLVPVSERDFAVGVAEIAQLLHEQGAASIGAVSTFGILTALFFHLVARSKPPVDWQIVEVGLGGTHDATNVFTTKAVAVLTPISLEHTAILGNDTGAIARQKSGIITAGTTVVLAPQRDRIVKDVVLSECTKVGARLIDVAEGSDCERVSFDVTEQRFCINSEEFGIGLGGRHQIVNASTALAVVAALNELGTTIDHAAIQKGLRTARLPGRFEVLQDTNTKSGITFVLDGAHNQDSASALAQALREYFPGRKCVFVLALNSDKKVEDFWKEMVDCSREVVVTKTDNLRALEPDILEKRISDCDSLVDVTCAQTVDQALEVAAARCQNGGIVCVTGSLYLVAEARGFLAERTNVPIPTNR
jgi:dihydrofolate synthase / folylpolyglutamate synthase